MLLSVSRRTDIPAFFSDWFFTRIAEGFVLVRNPMNHRQVACISLSPEVIDGIVFWTKNPAPMLGRLNALRAYPYYFHVTVTPYGQDIEQGLPGKESDIIPALQKLSGMTSPERVIWRYDPVLLNAKYTVDFHINAFERMASLLEGYVEKCVFGFVDDYKNVRRHAADLGIRPMPDDVKNMLAGAFADSAWRHGITLCTCCEELDGSPYGIESSACIDAALFERIAGYKLATKKDPNQRPECQCAVSIDIGLYNTCSNGCLYCYANYNEKLVAGQMQRHDSTSPLLVGHVEAEDKVYDRCIASCIDKQASFLD